MPVSCSDRGLVSGLRSNAGGMSSNSSKLKVFEAKLIPILPHDSRYFDTSYLHRGLWTKNTQTHLVMCLACFTWLYVCMSILLFCFYWGGSSSKTLCSTIQFSSLYTCTWSSPACSSYHIVLSVFYVRKVRTVSFWCWGFNYSFFILCCCVFPYLIIFNSKFVASTILSV